MKSTRRANEHIVPECDVGRVEHGAAVIGKKIVAYLYIVSKVAPEGRLYNNTFPHLPKNGFEDISPALQVRGLGVVELETFVLAFAILTPNLIV